MQDVPVKRIRDAIYADCKDCGYRVSPGIYWSLSKTMWLHTSGTNHKRFKLYGWPTEDAPSSAQEARQPSQ